MSGRILYNIGTHPYSFLDPDANRFFDTMVLGGFTKSMSDSLYVSGGTYEEIKEGLDTLFLGLKSDGVYTKLIKWCPQMGGLSTTVGINAVNPGTLDSTYTGSTLPYLYGVAHSGTSYENSGILPATHMSQNDFSIGCLANDDYITGGTLHLFGTQVSGSNNILKFRNDLSTAQVQAFPGGNSGNIIVAHGGTNNGLWIINRSSSTATQLYKNGSSVGTASIASVALTSNEMIFGGLNSGGSKNGSYIGAIRHSFAGTSLGVSDVTNFKNRLKAFDIILGINILP